MSECLQSAKAVVVTVLRPLKEILLELAQTMRAMYVQARIAAKQLTPIQWIVVVAVIAMLLVGNCGQIIFVNMWLSNFPDGMAGPFTVLTIASTFYFVVFFPILVAWLAAKRPKIGWFFRPTPMLLVFLIGLSNALNGVLLISATPLTPELLQAMLFPTAVVYTFILSRFLVPNHHRGQEGWVVLSIVITAAGVILGMASSFTGTHLTTSAKWWTVVFAISMIPASFLNVFQAKFMQMYATEGATDMTAKLLMLTVSCAWQAALMWVFFPLDIVPWFGSAPTMAVARTNISQGWECVLYACHGNFPYAIAFGMSYILVYISSAYLNHYSAPLCSIVLQISAPITAILLVIVPKWNVNQSIYNVGESVGAVVLILIGAIIYFLWEEHARGTDAVGLASEAQPLNGTAKPLEAYTV